MKLDYKNYEEKHFLSNLNFTRADKNEKPPPCNTTTIVRHMVFDDFVWGHSNSTWYNCPSKDELEQFKKLFRTGSVDYDYISHDYNFVKNTYSLYKCETEQTKSQ